MSAPIPESWLGELAALSATQLAWLSGYAWAKSQEGAPGALSGSLNAIAPASPSAAPPNVTPEASAPEITVLSASQTGNARKVGDALLAALQAKGLKARHVSAGEYKSKQLADETHLLVVAATQGDGEPPEEAMGLYKFLAGKKAPRLEHTRYAVLALGDTSYPDFCQAGKDFDERLKALGAQSLFERQDCDLDYESLAKAWIERAAEALAPLAQSQDAAAKTPQGVVPAQNQAQNESAYSKNTPFAAELLVSQKITGRDSVKNIRHYELDLAGSGIQYQPGDALGVWFENDAALVDEMLDALNLDASTEVLIKNEPMTLRHALTHELDITQNSAAFVKAYAPLTGNLKLMDEARDAHALAAAIPVIGLLQTYPASLTAQEFVDLLRPLLPRMYSIASAQEEVGEEVHICVALVEYEYDGKLRQGGASGFLARTPEESAVRVFIDSNAHFRLPENPDAPIIMIGAGTGMAPFRAFVQARAAQEASGKNWLIFGNPNFSQDFLYQTEWQTFAKEGFLNRYSFAWSRDQAQKVYVQDKIREEANDIWQWIEQGAHIYVCGDATKMAKDVEAALLGLFAAQGMDPDDADEYLETLRAQKRYQRDVY